MLYFIFNVVLWFGLAIALPLFVLKTRLGRSLSYEAGPASKTDGAPRRSFLLRQSEPKLVSTPHSTVKTIYDVLLYGVKTYPASKHLFGQREIKNIIKETKKVNKKGPGGAVVTEEKVWTFFELGPYKWETYRDVLAKVNQLGAGLVKLGIKAKDKVTIFHSTSVEWMTMSYACYSQNITITTAYDSLGVEALAFSLNEGEVGTLFTQVDLLNVVGELGGKCPSLKNIVYSGKLTNPKDLESAKAQSPTLTFTSYADLIELGKKNPIPANPPTPDDIACIMYTSGSTGNPKGVIITHRSLIACAGGAVDTLNACKGVVTGTDYYLGYLPLAHVLEFLIENFCVFKGVAIGYGSPKTLTDASVRNCKGDIKELRPTLMAGVPSVWETIRKGIQSKLAEVSPAKKFIFQMAFELKRFLIAWKLPSGFLDKSIFKSIKDGTGGRLRCAVSGGAPVAAETQEFLTVVLCPLLQGYGMTESCGMMTMQVLSDAGQYGNVGSPSSSVEIKLVACNNYNPNPAPGSGKPPQGEVWVRGGNVMKGYYKQPQVTKENLTDDGWLMTGDVGEWNPDGSLKIIDRKKNLVKLSHGEYVALEKLEAQYKTSKYLQNICIHADPLESKIIGIVVPDPKEIAALQKAKGINDPHNLNHEDILAEIGADFSAAASRANFRGAEILKSFVVVDGEWTADNGMLTAAQKIKRKEIVEKFKSEIDGLYGRTKK